MSENKVLITFLWNYLNFTINQQKSGASNSQRRNSFGSYWILARYFLSICPNTVKKLNKKIRKNGKYDAIVGVTEEKKEKINEREMHRKLRITKRIFAAEFYSEILIQLRIPVVLFNTIIMVSACIRQTLIHNSVREKAALLGEQKVNRHFKWKIVSPIKATAQLAYNE